MDIINDNTFEQLGNKFLSKKNILALLALGVLVLSIPFAVNLLQQQQWLKSRAAQAEIKFTGPNVKVDDYGNYTTTDPVVQVELSSPFGPPASAQ